MQLGPNTFNIHMFWLKILWKIQIQYYLRSDQVIESRCKSNFGQHDRIKIKSFRFDTKFGREFQLKAIGGRFRSLRELSGQTRDKIFEKGSNRSSWLINMQYTVYYIHRVYILYSNRLNKLFLKMYVYRYLWKAIILNNFSLVTMNEYDLRWVQKR